MLRVKDGLVLTPKEEIYTTFSMPRKYLKRKAERKQESEDRERGERNHLIHCSGSAGTREISVRFLAELGDLTHM